MSIQQIRATASEWTSNNPILLAGEIGYESNTGLTKIGDGSTSWNSLSYITLPSGGTDGQILARSGTQSTTWIDNYTTDVRIKVINNTGSTMYKGQAVYISNVGNNSDTPRVALAKADAESTSSKTLGLLMQDLEQGASGFVIENGNLSGFNTGTAVAGDPMWLSPTTAGGIIYGSSNKPVAPNHLVYLGVVVKASNGNSGIVAVKVQNGYEIDELHDVLITSKTDKDVLSYETSSGIWKNKTLANAGIAALTGATFTGNIAINNGTSTAITTTGTTASIFNTGATTLNIGGAASTINIGVAGGTVNILDQVKFAGGFGSGGVTISTNGDISGDGILSVDNASVNSTSVVTAATGWTISSVIFTKRNGIATINIGATRSGATITAGNITNTTICTINAGYRPLVESPGVSGPSGPLGSIYISAAGAVVVSALGTDLASGANFDVNATYILA